VTRGEGHWSLYCLNLIHGQIDILDPFPWVNEQDRAGFHGAIAGRIRGRLNVVFQEHTDGVFTDFSQFGLPFVSVPKFANNYDDALYIMLFMEHYDGALRKVSIGIDPVGFFVSQSFFIFITSLYIFSFSNLLIKAITGHVPFLQEFGTEYKAQILYYIIFHKLNAHRKELPEEICALAPR
jgi:hypothetical protein